MKETDLTRKFDDVGIRQPRSTRKKLNEKQLHMLESLYQNIEEDTYEVVRYIKKNLKEIESKDLVDVSDDEQKATIEALEVIDVITSEMLIKEKSWNRKAKKAYKKLASIKSSYDYLQYNIKINALCKRQEELTVNILDAAIASRQKSIVFNIKMISKKITAHTDRIHAAKVIFDKGDKAPSRLREKAQEAKEKSEVALNTLQEQLENEQQKQADLTEGIKNQAALERQTAEGQKKSQKIITKHKI